MYLFVVKVAAKPNVQSVFWKHKEENVDLMGDKVKENERTFSDSSIGDDKL